MREPLFSPADPEDEPNDGPDMEDLLAMEAEMAMEAEAAAEAEAGARTEAGGHGAEIGATEGEEDEFGGLYD